MVVSTWDCQNNDGRYGGQLTFQRLNSLENVLEEFKQDVLDTVRSNSRVVTVPMTTLLSAIKRRIHTDGLASDNSRIGERYSALYAAVRAAKGRQIQYVDLEVFGNMRNNLEINTIGENYAIGFTNDKQLIIAASHEERFGKPIFSPTDQEESDFFENLFDAIAADIPAR